MAASASCSSVGAAIDKLAGRLMHQGTSLSAEGSQLHVDCKKRIIRTDNDDGRHLRSSSSSNSSSNQASRFASIAVAATAWAGLSMCGPVEALAMAYEGEHQNVGESVIFTPTSMLDLAAYVKLPGDFIIIDDLNEEQGNEEVETPIGKVPSIKPPNEGSDSPWVPKINGPKKKDDIIIKTALMRCPKWTESELEMVLPDFQGRPKPFPRMQGHLYPYWPAMALTMDTDDALGTHERPTSPSSDDAVGTHERPTSPSSSMAPPSQELKKLPSCFTM